MKYLEKKISILLSIFVFAFFLIFHYLMISSELVLSKSTSISMNKVYGLYWSVDVVFTTLFIISIIALVLFLTYKCSIGEKFIWTYFFKGGVVFINVFSTFLLIHIIWVIAFFESLFSYSHIIFAVGITIYVLMASTFWGCYRNISEIKFKEILIFELGVLAYFGIILIYVYGFITPEIIEHQNQISDLVNINLDLDSQYIFNQVDIYRYILASYKHSYLGIYLMVSWLFSALVPLIIKGAFIVRLKKVTD